MIRRFFFTLALLSGSIPIFSQNSLFLTDHKLFKAGAGVTAYMNNLFLPSGMTGINLGTAWGGRNTGKTGSYRKAVINDFMIMFDYSRLMNRYGEQSLNHPTDLYNITFYIDGMFPLSRNVNAVNIFAGPGAGFKGGLCLNNYFSFRSLYHTPFYNEWNIFLGMSLLINFHLGNLAFENKFTMPFFLFGSWPEYGKSPDTGSLREHFRSTQFNTLVHYANPENSLSVSCPGFKIMKKPSRIFLTYSLALHSSVIDGVIQNYRKNAFYIGLVFNKMR